jgi:predicted Zn-dependent protease
MRKISSPEKEFPQAANMSAVARVLAVCGEGARAEKIADSLYKECPTDTLQNAVFLPDIRAWIALRQKLPEHAIELLKAAVPYERRFAFINYDRGMAYLAAGNGGEAAAQFQIVLDHRGRNRLNQIYPLSYVGLARAALLAGDKARARKAYQDFLQLWKDADKDIPVLVEAKKEYDRL